MTSDSLVINASRTKTGGLILPGMIFVALGVWLTTLDPAEIDRKITELRIVENWLSMSLNMMQMSIKTLELQRASLEALSAAQQSMQTGATPKTTAGK